MPGGFGGYLRAVSSDRGIDFSMAAVSIGLVQLPLRQLLQKLTPVWAEVSIGNSYWEYRALDAYVSCFGAQTKTPEQQAWYLLNVEHPAGQRRMLWPEDWHTCRTWKSMGQKPCMFEWDLQYVAAKATLEQPLRARL